MTDVLEIIKTLKKRRPELSKDPLFNDLEMSMAEDGAADSEDYLMAEKAPMSEEDAIVAGEELSDEEAMAGELEADAAIAEGEEDADLMGALDEAAGKAPAPKKKKKKPSYLDEEEEDESISPPGNISGSY